MHSCIFSGLVVAKQKTKGNKCHERLVIVILGERCQNIPHMTRQDKKKTKALRVPFPKLLLIFLLFVSFHSLFPILIYLNVNISVSSKEQRFLLENAIFLFTLCLEIAR